MPAVPAAGGVWGRAQLRVRPVRDGRPLSGFEAPPRSMSAGVRPWMTSLLALAVCASACTADPSVYPRAEAPNPDPVEEDASAPPADAAPPLSPGQVVPPCRNLELCDAECEYIRRGWTVEVCGEADACVRAADVAYAACYGTCVDLYGAGGQVEAAYLDYRACLVTYALGREHSLGHAIGLGHVDATYYQAVDLVCLHDDCGPAIAACRGDIIAPDGDLDCAGISACVEACPDDCEARCPGAGAAWRPLPAPDAGAAQPDGVFPLVLGCRAACERRCTHACEARARDPMDLRAYWSMWSCLANYRTQHCDPFVARCANGGASGDEGVSCDNLDADPAGACGQAIDWMTTCFDDPAFCGAADPARLAELMEGVTTGCQATLAERCDICRLESCDQAVDYVFGVDVYSASDVMGGLLRGTSVACRPGSRLCREVLPANHAQYDRLCAQCATDDDCAGSPHPRCEDGLCKACTRADCLAQGHACHRTRGCVACDEANVCGGDALCVEARCVACDHARRFGCSSPEAARCDPDGACVPCVANDDCRGFPAAPYCADGACRAQECESTAECGDPLRPVCDADASACRPCAAHAECPAGEADNAGPRCLGGCCVECVVDADRPDGEACGAGRCAP